MCSDIGAMWGQSALTHGTPDTRRPLAARRASTPAYVQLYQTAAVTSGRLHASQPELLATPKKLAFMGHGTVRSHCARDGRPPKKRPTAWGPRKYRRVGAACCMPHPGTPTALGSAITIASSPTNGCGLCLANKNRFLANQNRFLIEQK